MSPTGNRSPEAGYTLLELLVVVAILAFSVAALSVGFSFPGEQSDLEAAVRQLEADLETLSVEALVDGQVQTVRLDPDNRQYSWGETIRSLPGGVVMEVETGDRPVPPTISFFPNGRNTGAFVTLRKGDDQAHLRTSRLTGAITRGP